MRFFSQPWFFPFIESPAGREGLKEEKTLVVVKVILRSGRPGLEKKIPVLDSPSTTLIGTETTLFVVDIPARAP